MTGNRSIKNLPADIHHYIVEQFLPESDASRYARSCKLFYDRHKKHIRTSELQVKQLLHHIARGGQYEAELMLIKDPGLLLEKSGFTDYSGRSFSHVTAFQLADWYLDTHMCRMLRKYLPDDKAMQQLKEIPSKGLEYILNGMKYQERYFDVKPLIDAYQAYIPFYRQVFYHSDDILRDKMDKHWQAVGMAQRMLPAHAINEYFHPTRSLVVDGKPPLFNEAEDLPRLTYNKYFSFYSMLSDSGLGYESYSMVRAGEKKCMLVPGWGDWLGPRAFSDCAAIRRLFEVRLCEARQREQLVNSVPESAATCIYSCAK